VRLRNVKNKQEIMDNSSYLILNPKDYYGKWQTLFNNSNPIQIEIGSGKGNFIITKALVNPNINFIGIEKFDSVIARCLEKIPVGIPNLKMIRMNALEIDSVFNHEIDTIYLNFSDPWPKKRWYKRRLTSSIFLEKYDSLFKEDLCIIQKTDNRDLFEYSICSLSSFGYIIKDISLDLHKSNIEGNIMTEYEEKFSRSGSPIYYLTAVKKK
jgi:tRNA (guanine-N7-)-methyltransferase